MSKTLKKYIVRLDYAGKNLVILSGAGSGVSLCSFATIVGAPIGIVDASISLVFLGGYGILKKYLKTMGSKLNSIEKIISRAPADAEISHEEFTLVSNETENYRRLKDSIRTKDSQGGDIEKDRLIDYDKLTGVDEILRQNYRQSLKLKSEV